MAENIEKRTKVGPEVDKERDETKDEFEQLAVQVRSEYVLAWDHQHPKVNEWQARLRLYNNQKRKKKDVGDTTLFTIFQTVLASLYNDRLMVDWIGRDEGDEEVAENLNALAEYDYDEMEKDKLDYFWIWDTLFFGRGIMALHEFKRDPDKGVFIPVPEVWDPLTFLRDPTADSVNGSVSNRSGARFFGRELKMTKEEIKNHPHIFFDDFRTIKLGGGIKSLLETAQQARDDAQGRQQQKLKVEASLGDNAQYDITEWFTRWQGKRVKLYLANQRRKVIGYKELESDYWEIIDRPLYPTSHDWDGTSIPDLVEDKQRMRAVAQNLGIKAMKADLYPMYIYDANKIQNKNDLDFNFNKFIPAEGDVANAITPLRKAYPNLPLLDFIFNSLDVSAQKATATPELQQGRVSEEQRTLGEINLIASRVDTRYSLSAKVFGWSEKRFWRQWYQLYKRHFEDKIDEKVLRIVGAFGPKWRPLKRENIIADIDPDVKIESQVVSRAKELEERQSLTTYFSLALQDPTANRRWGLKKLGGLNGLEKDEIERLFPPTIDERIAEDQNELLSENKTVPVLAEDDHNVHLEIHSKAADTDATYAHIEAHKKALSVKKTRPELFPPEEPEETAFQPPGTTKIVPEPTKKEAPKPIKPSQTSGIKS